MITKITLDKINSYKKLTILETDKKVNLIYGLNGTGKSTFSDYLNQRVEEKYKKCSIEGLDDNHDILVYNQTFIQDNFFEAENLKGIFTLSKKNKEAETKITNAEKEIKRIESENALITAELETANDDIASKLETAKNTIWEIKKKYTGGDRVLEFCLEGYKNDGNKLFSFIAGLSKPTTKPTKSIDELKNDLQSISGDNAQKHSTLSQISFASQNIEREELFSKQIVGNENSTVSQLITALGNSDWVKEGLQYLPKAQTQENSTCPFCQEKTISSNLIESIRN